MKRRLENYRSARRELDEMRARMRRAELQAAHSVYPRDRERAADAAALYEAMADTLSEELRELELAIERLPEERVRRAVRLRYIDGHSRARTALEMDVSERTVVNLIAEAMRTLGG